jgi:hypothetical protein
VCIVSLPGSGILLCLHYYTSAADCDIHSDVVPTFGPRLHEPAAVVSDTGMFLALGPRLYEPAVDSDTGIARPLGALGYTPLDNNDSGMVPLAGSSYRTPVDGSGSGILLFGALEYTPMGQNGFGIALAVLVAGNGGH